MIKERIDVLKSIASNEQLEAILIFGKGNVRYFTSYEPFLGDVMFILNADGSKFLVNRFEWDRSSIPSFFNEDEIISSYDFADTIISLISNRSGSIGICGMADLPFKTYCSIVSVSNNIVELDQEFAKIRMIKSDQEIDLLKKAVDITEEAIKVAVSNLKVGVSEAEIGAIFEYEVKRRNAPELAFGSSVAFGKNSSEIAWIPGEKKLEKGEAVFFDVGARYKGYCADVGRTFFMGQPSEEYLKLYNTMLAIQNELLDFIKPGMSAVEPYLKVEELFEKNGLGLPRHRLGHGLGIETSMEGPDLKYGDSILKPNMTFAIEISHPGTDEGGVKIEDNVVLREDGCELLSVSSKELILL